jgi:hypothetical protein
MSNDLFISNLKLSTKVNPMTIDELEQLCLNKDILYDKFDNFICFNIKRKKTRSIKNPEKLDHFAYSIWKKAECLKNNKWNPAFNNKSHCNISKVKENEIGKCLRKLKRFLDISTEKIKYKIDNITATIKTDHKINLKKFEKQNRYKENISYNPERFPGLVIKKNNLTYIVFTSGSINIVGGKSRKQILEGIPWIKSIVSNLKRRKEYKCCDSNFCAYKG